MIAAAVQREMTHIFSATSGRLLARLDGHANRVTGVCWDPQGGIIVSQSSDRTARVYAKKKNGSWYPKALLKEVDIERPDDSEAAALAVINKWKLFISESHYPSDPTAHFFRRPDFSPDGSMVVLPGGLSEPDSTGSAKFVTHLFSRKALATGQGPTGILSTPCSPAMAVRFHPRPWLAKETGTTFFTFVVTTVSSFYVMRSDKAKPVAFGTGLHCTAIVDASWSSDGQLLALCSTDGYMTLVKFDENELGGVPDWSMFVPGPPQSVAAKPVAPVAEELSIVSNNENSDPNPTTNKRRITPVIVVNTKE
jgi:chromatin assembly factor 1 subunit B